MLQNPHTHEKKGKESDLHHTLKTYRVPHLIPNSFKEEREVGFGLIFQSILFILLTSRRIGRAQYLYCVTESTSSLVHSSILGSRFSSDFQVLRERGIQNADQAYLLPLFLSGCFCWYVGLFFLFIFILAFFFSVPPLSLSLSILLHHPLQNTQLTTNLDRFSPNYARRMR